MRIQVYILLDEFECNGKRKINALGCFHNRGDAELLLDKYKCESDCYEGEVHNFHILESDMWEDDSPESGDY